MYVGRLVVVAPGLGAYRVSSRSFPNRRIVERDAGTLTVGPTPDAPETDNPYVSYNCVRVVGGAGSGARGADERPSGYRDANARHSGARAVVGNGSHVDPIAEKLGLGYPARDALATGLLTMDYEKDDYDTPRIAGVVSGGAAHLGIVRHDALLVRTADEPTLVATYERDAPEPFEFEARTAEEAARAAYDLDFEHPVCAAGVSVEDGEILTAVANEPGG